MSRERKYARVYFDDLEREFPDIWFDAVLRGEALLLLVAAERSWPSSPEIPRICKASAIKRIAASGLITLEPPYRFRFRGLDKEREARRSGARHAATERWRNAPGNAERTANGKASASGTRMPSLAKPSQDETRLAEQDARADDPADAYWQLTGKYPSGKLLTWIDEATEKYGSESIIRSLAVAHQSDSNPSTLMGRAQDLWRREARALDRREQEDERARLREKRAQPRTLEPWQQAYRDALVERYGQDAA